MTAATDIGKLADSLYAKDQEIDKVQAKLKVLTTERSDLHSKLLEQMDAIGTETVKTKKTMISVSETTRVSIKDAEAAFAFILRNKALHLFERRISVNAYKELKEAKGGKALPGLSEFVQRRLNVRTVS